MNVLITAAIEATKARGCEQRPRCGGAQYDYRRRNRQPPHCAHGKCGEAEEAFESGVYRKRKALPEREKKLAAQSAAGMFCAKEAVLKALSLGIIDAKLTDIEILHKTNGAPYAVLHGSLKMEASTAYQIITHAEETASAVAILERERGDRQNENSANARNK